MLLAKTISIKRFIKAIGKRERRTSLKWTISNRIPFIGWTGKWTANSSLPFSHTHSECIQAGVCVGLSVFVLLAYNSNVTRPPSKIGSIGYCSLGSDPFNAGSGTIKTESLVFIRISIPLSLPSTDSLTPKRCTRAWKESQDSEGKRDPNQSGRNYSQKPIIASPPPLTATHAASLNFN